MANGRVFKDRFYCTATILLQVLLIYILYSNTFIQIFTDSCCDRILQVVLPTHLSYINVTKCNHLWYILVSVKSDVRENLLTFYTPSELHYNLHVGCAYVQSPKAKKGQPNHIK